MSASLTGISQLREICAACRVCTFMTRTEDPKLSFDLNIKTPDETPLILVLDDAANLDEAKLGATRAWKLLGDKPFTYSQTVRCSYEIADLTPLGLEEATKRCAVWTHNVTDNRLVMLATQTALRQLKVKKPVTPGDAFQSVRLGMVLCIPPLHILDSRSSAWSVYETKVQRLLNSAGV